MIYDAVIIGAGPSGLAAAARLAHFGVSVCLLEAHSRLGGLNSWHHIRGREISSGLHAFTNYSPDGKGGPLGKLLRQLRLKYADLELKPQSRSSIRFPSAALAFTNDPGFLRQSVAETFPGQIDNFDRLRTRINSTDEGELTPRHSSARDVIEQYLTDPLLADMLLCPVMFYGSPGGVGDGLDQTRSRPDMDWLLFCVVWKCIFESGFGHPAHGMRPLWEKLAARIVEDGGAVRLKARVERFVVKNGGVAEAVLADGETIRGRVFLSSAGGKETERLLGQRDGTARPAGTISIVEGVSLLDRPAADAGMTDTVIFYSFSDRLAFRRPDGLIEPDNGVVCASGNYLPASTGDDNVLKVSQLANHAAWRALARPDYLAAKRGAADGMSRALARLGIDLAPARNHPAADGTMFDDVFTPLTLERFTSHLEGALYGSPVKSRTGVTSCSNLFLIGADQGFHGIVGAMLSGVAMANLHVLSGKR